MKHIKLFENFDTPTGDGDSIIFDFLAFDDQVDNPINNTVPQEIGIEKVMEYCKNNPEINKVGLFIAHSKIPSGGFIRYIVTSTNPVTLDSATFDSEFKLVNENKGISPEDLQSHKSGTSLLRRMGIGGKEK